MVARWAHSTPALSADDPRCQTDAYIALATHLYEVVGVEKGRLQVRNCKTEYLTTLSPLDVDRSRLVRAATVIAETIPEEWSAPPVEPVAQIESD